jgi:hypothetical protein
MSSGGINQEINKRNFIHDELEWWSNYVTDAVIKELLRRKIGITRELQSSIHARARQEIAELGFLTYGRYVDMGAGRGYRKGVESIKKNRELLTAGRISKRKPKKFYSKVSYGTLGRLYQRLVSNYQDTIIYGLKETIKTQL